MKKWLIIAAFVGVSLWAILSFKNLMRFPLIISRWDAKEYCSCHFVLGRDDDFCAERVRQWIPIQSRQVDERELMVTSTGFWFVAHAKFLGPEEGCRIVDTAISGY